VKENVLDVLMYLFENYMDEGPDFPPDQETLTSELTEAGFARGEISKAFSWLETLSQVREGLQSMSAGRGGMRHYHPVECGRLDKRCRGFLQQMESSGVLDAITRELVLDRVMALGTGDISLEQLKWVMWMVLFHQPGQEYAHSVLEELVFDERDGYLH
jgi:Smg protein